MTEHVIEGEAVELIDPTASLATALVAAQAELPPVEPNATNPHFKSKFVTLDHLLAKVRPVLNKHGLAVVQFPSIAPGGEPALTTMLLHVSGERITEQMLLLAAKQDPQAQGSALTYARRYALAAVLGISSEADDDAEQAVTAAVDKPPADPFTVLPASFPAGDDLMDRIGTALSHVDPSVDWRATWDSAIHGLYDSDRPSLQPGPLREAWTRLAHVAAMLSEGGDFPPPDDDRIREAFAQAFGGVVVTVERHELAGADDPLQAEAEQIPFGD